MSDRRSHTTGKSHGEGGDAGGFRDKIGWQEWNTYQGGICNRAHAILEFSVKEIAKALVLRQILDFDLFQVATEDPGIKSETVGSEPNWEFERVDVSP